VGARHVPVLVPTRPVDPASADNRRAWETLVTFDKPFLCAFSDSDPITRGADRHLKEMIPGCAGQPHTTIEGAGHFLQEDKGEELAAVIVEFIDRT
jgi:haloalkane dehalogenase